MVHRSILPSTFLYVCVCGECLLTELRDKQRKYPPCFPQDNRVAGQSHCLQPWEMEAAGPLGVWEGWRSSGAAGENACLHLGPTLATWVSDKDNFLPFHPPLAAALGRLKWKARGERGLCCKGGGWESTRGAAEATLNGNLWTWFWRALDWQG